MLTKVFRSGSSLAVRLPKELSFEEGVQDVEIVRTGDALVIQPIRRDSLTGVAGAFSAFPPGFMAEGREPNEPNNTPLPCGYLNHPTFGAAQ